jgi:hypothetical protein
MSANGLHPEGLVSPLGSEVANGFVAGDRTRPQCRNRSARLAALAVALALISTPTEVHAYTCAPDKTIAIALCQEGACTDGFEIDHESIPDTMCGRRPVVRALSDEVRSSFQQIAGHLDQKDLSGVYELETYPDCLGRGWQEKREWCLATATITKVSESIDPQTLNDYRTEWLVKEQQARRSAMFRHWGRPVVFILLTIFSLGWSWLLVILMPSLRKYTGYLLILAIPIQLFVYYLFFLYRSSFFAVWVPVWNQLALVCGFLILLAIPSQLGFLIWKKFKTKPRTS